MPATFFHGISGCWLFAASGMPRLASETISMPRCTSQRSSQLDSNSGKVLPRVACSIRSIASRISWRICRSFVPSEHAHGGLLDVTPQHRMQTIACRNVNGKFQFFLKKLLDADQVQRVKFTVWIVVDEEVEIAGLLGLVTRGRTKEIKGCRAHGFDRLGAIFQL